MDVITFQPYQEWRGIDILINGRNLDNATLFIFTKVDPPQGDKICKIFMPLFGVG